MKPTIERRRGRALLAYGVAAAIASCACLPAHAQGGTTFDVPPDRPAGERAPPDSRDCVKLCEFDLNPCDPPQYKKLDGRCTNSR